MTPDQLRFIADCLRAGEGQEYLQPRALSRLRYEAATGKGHPRSPQDWRTLQTSMEGFRHAEDGDRVTPVPFAPKHAHDPSYEGAPPGSDKHVIHRFNKQVNQHLEDDQLGEMLSDRMGSDASRRDDRPPSLRDSLEAAYEVHSPSQGD